MKRTGNLHELAGPSSGGRSAAAGNCMAESFTHGAEHPWTQTLSEVEYTARMEGRWDEDTTGTRSAAVLEARPSRFLKEVY